jgi:hypothetical protein
MQAPKQHEPTHSHHRAGQRQTPRRTARQSTYSTSRSRTTATGLGISNVIGLVDSRGMSLRRGILEVRNCSPQVGEGRSRKAAGMAARGRRRRARRRSSVGKFPTKPVDSDPRPRATGPATSLTSRRTSSVRCLFHACRPVYRGLVRMTRTAPWTRRVRRDACLPNSPSSPPTISGPRSPANATGWHLRWAAILSPLAAAQMACHGVRRDPRYVG